jgi:hypothetical protein
LKSGPSENLKNIKDKLGELRPRLTIKVSPEGWSEIFTDYLYVSAQTWVPKGDEPK